MDNKKCNSEDEIISSRMTLSLTGGNSYILVNNAEEYYRQLEDALFDIKNETPSSYLYFAFITLSSATLEYSLNLIVAWYYFDKYHYPECNRYIKAYMEEYKKQAFKTKLSFVPTLVSEGEYILNRKNRFVVSLEKMISIRNNLLHNKEKIQVFASPDLGAKVMDGGIWVPIENAEFSFQIETIDNVIKTLSKDICVEIGEAMLEFKRQILNPALTCCSLLDNNMLLRIKW